jgi:flagellar basal-body rod modification protein FlgD
LSSIDDSVSEGVDVDLLLTQAINNTLATTLIGKEVIAFGDTVRFNGSDETDLSFRLSNAAENVEISIYDEQGTVVRTMSLKAMGSGDHTITWNGENNEGEDLPEGNYTFSVTATGADGNAIDSYTLTRGIISSVLYQDGAAVLMMNGRQIQFSDVLEIG